MHHFPTRRLPALAFLIATIVLTLTPIGPVQAQTYGLDAPSPVGPFLDNVLPHRTPQAPGSSDRDVVECLPQSCNAEPAGHRIQSR